jgi:DNA invertase Pin-like site-specific DNA recombinase
LCCWQKKSNRQCPGQNNELRKVKDEGWKDFFFYSVRPADALTVWRLDRLGRTPPHIVEMLYLVVKGVGFKSLQPNIDTYMLIRRSPSIFVPQKTGRGMKTVFSIHSR